VVLGGEALDKMDEDGRARVRNQQVGFVFQNFQLIPTLTAIENVLVPVELRGERGKEPEARELLTRVGLGERCDHYPVQLSGGEQQRVALARASVGRPAVLFADEPTGNLDSATGERIAALLFELNAGSETTLILVTHDRTLASRCGRVLTMDVGALTSVDAQARAAVTHA
jgi:putative ABC transport system ATP-binding protein